MEELSEWFPQFYPITGLGQSGAVSPEYRFMPRLYAMQLDAAKAT